MPVTSTPPEPLIDIAAVSVFLGDIPIATLYNWRSQGIGPRSIKIGRHVRYRAADVRAWIDSREAAGDVA